MHLASLLRTAAVATSATLVLGLTGPPAEALTVEDLRSAPVPSMCGHPAGTLVNGSLPGVGPNDGGVWLNEAATRFGKLRKEPGQGAAAAFTCNRGGVGWPDHVVFYSPQREILGHVDLLQVTKGGRETIRKIRITKRVVTIQVQNIGDEEDYACCGSKGAQLTYRWSAKAKQMVLKRKRLFTERQAAQALVAAVNRGDRRAARHWLAAESVAFVWKYVRPGHRLKVGQCHGPLSDEWYPDYMPGEGERFCYVSALATKAGESDQHFWAVRLQQVTWKRYKGSAFFGFD